MWGEIKFSVKIRKEYKGFRRHEKVSHTADGCEISTVSRSRYACSKCICAPSFSSTRIERGKRIPVFLRAVLFDRLEHECSYRASLLGFCATRLFFSLSLCAGCGCLRVTQRDAHRCVFHNQMTLIYPVKIFFQFLLKIKEFFEI